MRKRQKWTYLFYTIMLSLALPYSSHAQVTIGALLKPEKGALLQLKETDAEGANSTKGLLLPRVKITTLHSLDDLKPGLDEAAHTGLMIFNPKEDFCASDYVYKGVYTWEGDKWKYAGKDKQLAAGISTYVDRRDGTVYRYRDFGPVAGVWMLDDMRARTYDQGGDPLILSTEDQTAPALNKQYCYPAPSGDGTDDSFYKKQPAIGILYNWAAALNIGANGGIPNPGTTNQGEDGNDVLQVGPQGICPNGWHIPSDKEWNDVEEEIATYPEKYSTNSGTTWDNNWRFDPNNAWRPTATTDAPGHGQSMKSGCQPISSAVAQPSGGTSFLPSDGGFNILLVGDGYEGAMHNHGDAVSFWTGSMASNGAAWARYFRVASNGVFRLRNDKSRLFSVRCKRD